MPEVTTFDVSGSLATTELPDSVQMVGDSGNSGTLATTEFSDFVQFSGDSGITGSLATTEAPDVVDFEGVIPPPKRPALFPGRDKHVRRTGDDYGYALMALLPRGQAWPRDPGSTLVLTMTGLADYWGFVDGRAADLLEIESDPRATRELLPDWERNWGLPDPCIKEPISLPDRRRALVAKMTMIGGQSREFFYHIGNEVLHYHISITEFAPYMCGVSRCGDYSGVFNSGDPTHNRWYLGPREMRFFWTVHVDSLRLTYFYCNASQCGVDRLLRIATADDLECLFNRWKPAQTQVIFDYSPQYDADMTKVYNTMYLPLGVP